MKKKSLTILSVLLGILVMIFVWWSVNGCLWTFGFKDFASGSYRAQWCTVSRKQCSIDFGCGYIPLQGAHVRTFTVIEDGYSKDKNHVYYLSTQIMGADPQTFQLTQQGYGYSRDYDSVFYQTSELVGANPDSFATIKFPYSKDSEGVYYYANKIPNADPGSFVFLKEGYEVVSYAKDNNRVYCAFPNSVIKWIEGADPHTFRFWASEGTERAGPWTYDDNNFYYNCEVIGSDPSIQ